MRYFAVIGVVGVAFSLATSAEAAPAKPEPAPAVETNADKASKLREQGNEAMLGMRYSDALVFYRQAFELTPDNYGFLYSQARAAQFVGDYPEALAMLERFDKEAPAETKAKVGKLDELFAQLRPRVGTLDLKTSQNGARVIVREKVVGTTPLPPTRLIAGSADVQIELEGFFTEKREVVIPGAGAASVNIELHLKSSNGLVSIKTQPIGAHIRVDGKEVGTTSAAIELALGAGPHDVIATHEGFNDAKVPLVLRAGATKDITLTLDKSVPLTARWWFWTAIGVVVVGGVAVTYALVTEKSADKGSLGQVAAPLLKF